MDHFTPSTDPVLNSVAWSAIVALLPLLTFFILLAVVKTRAHVAGAFALLTALLVGIVIGIGIWLNSKRKLSLFRFCFSNISIGSAAP